MSVNTVTNWEKNRTSPDLRSIPRVLEFLGYDPRKTRESMAERLTAFRQARGLSQRELAEILNVDASTLSKWEQGKRTPVGQYFQRIRLIMDSQ